MSRTRIELRPTSEAGYERTRAALRAELAAWAKASGREGLDPDCGEELLHYKWGYLDGHLGRWTRADLDAVLLELYPAKVIVADEDLDACLSEARTFISFLAEAGHLDPQSDDPVVLDRHLERLAGRFRRRMADARRYSSGKRLWLAMKAEGIRPDDERAVEAWSERFNARPLAERVALLGSPPRAAPAWAGPGRFTPGGPRPEGIQRRTPRGRRHR